MCENVGYAFVHKRSNFVLRGVWSCLCVFLYSKNIILQPHINAVTFPYDEVPPQNERLLDQMGYINYLLPQMIPQQHA